MTFPRATRLAFQAPSPTYRACYRPRLFVPFAPPPRVDVPFFGLLSPKRWTTPGGERWSRDLLLHRSAHNNTAQPTEWGGGGARVEKGVKAGEGGRHR